MPLILGVDRSGRSLLGAILNCSPGINAGDLCTNKLSYTAFKQEGLRLLDILHAEYSRSNQKFIWLLRHPLESSCSMYRLGISHLDGLSYWFDVNTIIWYFLHSVPQSRKMLIHFESLLLNDSLLKAIFEFCDVVYNKQYLRYGDFDQFNFDHPIFKRGIRHGEMVNFYDHSEKICSQWCRMKNKKIIMQFGYTTAQRR